jgi:hypothetical protein
MIHLFTPQLEELTGKYQKRLVALLWHWMQELVYTPNDVTSLFLRQSE